MSVCSQTRKPGPFTCTEVDSKSGLMSSVATSQRLASQTAASCSHSGSDEIMRPKQFRGGGPNPCQMQRKTACHRRLRGPRFKYFVQTAAPRGCAIAKTNLLIRHNRSQRYCIKVQHDSERLEDNSVAKTCRSTEGISLSNVLA